MIAVRLMGGLGNQMFQYAAGRALADRQNALLALDVSRYAHQPAGETPREYELDCFSIRADVTTERIRATALRLPSYIPRRRLRLIRERGYAFQHDLLEASDDILLEGYWQSELYFRDNAKAIRSDFSLRRPLSSHRKELASAIDEKTICVQVRRGDYVSHPGASKFHGTLSVEYYRSAVARLALAIRSPQVLVISDDPQWCAQHLDLGLPMAIAPHDPGAGYEGMALMRLCRHLVIGNSSFGWWGAWLSEAETVIAPRDWFADKSVDTRDLIPPNWARI